MCPACISTLALIAVGAGSGGGLTAFLVRRRRGGRDAKHPEGTTRPVAAASQEPTDEERIAPPSDPGAAEGRHRG